MKRIYFDKQSSPFNKLLALVMIVFLTIYIFTTLTEGREQLNSITGVIGLSASIIFFGKQFIFRNYFAWNKKGFVIKTNSFFSKSYSFAGIEAYSFNKSSFEVIEQNGNKVNFDLTKVRPEDIQRVQAILHEHLPATVVNS